MSKRFACLVAGLGLAATVAPFSGTAHAEPECAGFPTVAETYVCLMRYETPEVVEDGPIVTVPSLCLPVFGCSDPVSHKFPFLNAHSDEVAVIYYLGKCFYVGTDLPTMRNATSTAPPACP